MGNSSVIILLDITSKRIKFLEEKIAKMQFCSKGSKYINITRSVLDQNIYLNNQAMNYLNPIKANKGGAELCH